ncbi:hypothetical protein Y032_0199g1643 [Ancylostoma ceylanicum]|uniref:Uncharacterized protein n=1 Tax=Ancylostoma ceylanicum TaxID=53326 RepID=A0A016SMP5_9BILA|nr:hypothetical protein Y032_0199g1643 [Ancylostoma ceylanicum]
MVVKLTSKTCVLPHIVCLGSESTSCRNLQSSTADSRLDHEETLRLKSPARKLLDQSCVGRLTTAPSSNAALIQRLDTIADSPDLKPYIRRPKSTILKNPSSW